MRESHQSWPIVVFLFDIIFGHFYFLCFWFGTRFTKKEPIWNCLDLYNRTKPRADSALWISRQILQWTPKFEWFQAWWANRTHKVKVVWSRRHTMLYWIGFACFTTCIAAMFSERRECVTMRAHGWTDTMRAAAVAAFGIAFVQAQRGISRDINPDGGALGWVALSGGATGNLCGGARRIVRSLWKGALSAIYLWNTRRRQSFVIKRWVVVIALIFDTNSNVY